LLREAIAKLSRHTLTYTVAEQLSRLASFLLLPLTTGYLSVQEFGTREILATTLAVLAQAAGLNVTAAMSRFYFDEREPARRAVVVSTTVLSVAGISGALSLLLGALSPWIAKVLPPDTPELALYLRISLGIFVFQMLREVGNKVLQAQERSTLYGCLAVTKLVTEIGLQIYFLVGREAGLEGLLWAVLIAEATFAAITYSILLPSIGLRFSPAVFVALFAYSLPLVPHGVLQFGLHSADRYLVGWLGSDVSLGLYTLGYKLGYVPNYLVLSPFLLIWFPFVFSIQDDARRRELIARLTPYFMLVMTAAALAVSLFAREIVELATTSSAFHPAWIAIPWVAFGYWLWGLFQVLQTGFYVVKVTSPLPLLTGAAVAVNLYLNFMLIPSLGYLGAALATTATFGVLCVLAHAMAREVYFVAHEWRRILIPALAAALGCAAAYLVEPYAGVPGWVLKLVLFVLWIAWSWFGGAIGRDERAAALDMARNAVLRPRPAHGEAAGDR
jgi:O-antigen/teichoic acid export membrane protein